MTTNELKENFSDAEIREITHMERFMQRMNQLRRDNDEGLNNDEQE